MAEKIFEIKIIHSSGLRQAMTTRCRWPRNQKKQIFKNFKTCITSFQKNDRTKCVQNQQGRPSRGFQGAYAPLLFLHRPKIIHIRAQIFLPRPENTYVIASKTHKRFKRLKFTKAMFWYYYFENKTDDSQPIRSFSPLGGKTIRLVPHHWVSTPVIGQNWNSQFSFASHHWVNTQSWVNPHGWGISSQNHINMGSKVANIFIISHNLIVSTYFKISQEFRISGTCDFFTKIFLQYFESKGFCSALIFSEVNT